MHVDISKPQNSTYLPTYHFVDGGVGRVGFEGSRVQRSSLADDKSQMRDGHLVYLSHLLAHRHGSPTRTCTRFGYHFGGNHPRNLSGQLGRVGGLPTLAKGIENSSVGYDNRLCLIRDAFDTLPLHCPEKTSHQLGDFNK